MFLYTISFRKTTWDIVQQCRISSLDYNTMNDFAAILYKKSF